MLGLRGRDHRAANNDRLLPSSRPRAPIGGAVSVAAHDAASDPKGEPDGHRQIENKTLEDHTKNVSNNKTPRQEQRPGSTEEHRCDQCRHFKSGIIEISCVFVLQTVGGAEDAV